MVILAEDSPRDRASAAASDIRHFAEAARLVGFQVYSLPRDFSKGVDADAALAYLNDQPVDTPGMWIGFIPDAQQYAALYAAALKKNVRLLNSPEEHLRIIEFDRFYPALNGLTPKSVVVSSLAQCSQAIEELGFPMFIKGAVKSRKEQGWRACVAHNREELEQMCHAALQRDYTARNKMIARELVELRSVQTALNGFPMGREFRCFLYQNILLGYGYYWNAEDPLNKLAAEEEASVCQLAKEASGRIGVPFAVVDVGQTKTGEWIVIETGDPQFCGVPQMSPFQFWHRLKEIIAASATSQ